MKRRTTRAEWLRYVAAVVGLLAAVLILDQIVAIEDRPAFLIALIICLAVDKVASR